VNIEKLSVREAEGAGALRWNLKSTPFGFGFSDLRFDFGISNIATNRKRREIKFQTDPLPLLRTIPAPATDTVEVRVPPLLL